MSVLPSIKQQNLSYVLSNIGLGGESALLCIPGSTFVSVSCILCHFFADVTQKKDTGSLVPLTRAMAPVSCCVITTYTPILKETGSEKQLAELLSNSTLFMLLKRKCSKSMYWKKSFSKDSEALQNILASEMKRSTFSVFYTFYMFILCSPRPKCHIRFPESPK